MEMANLVVALVLLSIISLRVISLSARPFFVVGSYLYFFAAVGLGNKYSKAKAMESLKKDKSSTIVGEKSRDGSLTSSSGFFNKLQDSVREEIHKKNQNGKKEKKNKTSSAHCRL